MLMAPTLPKIGPGQQPYVERVLADPLFATAKTDRHLFDYLARETLKDGFEQRNVDDVARDYFGTGSLKVVNRFGVQKARLSRRLERYYRER